MLSATNLTCMSRPEPLGFDERMPRLGWQVESDREWTLQTAWHIQVALDATMQSLIWDSGWTAGEESNHVCYDGPVLESCTRYYWRVRIHDSHGRESDWSQPTWFETGLMQPEVEWQAPFISPEPDNDPAPSAARRLRRAFGLPDNWQSARIYATALGLYELSLNGRTVSEDLLRPGWTEYHKRLQYQVYDVTALLQSGENVLGATVGCGWYKGFLMSMSGLRRNVYGSRTALSLMLRVTLADGSLWTLTTDQDWRAADGPILSSELYHGETYDARLEDMGWDEPGYDDRHWRAVLPVAVDPAILVAQEGPPVRRQERIKPVALLTTPRGEQVIDFGQNLAGRVCFEVNGLSGERVILRHAEVLDAAGNFYTENLRSARSQIEYILHGGRTEIYEPHFTFQGFRYVQVVSYPGPVMLDAFTAVVIHSDFPVIGDFNCSNPLVNQLFHNILWGLKGNFIDLPTDCPQRDERLGWTGDAQVFAGTALRLAGVGGFFRKWLSDLAAAQLEDGGVPYVIPDILTKGDGHSATGWGDAAVICPWAVWQAEADRSLLARQYASMKAWVDFMTRKAGPGLIWNTGFHFGDWLALDAREGSYFGATPNDLTATAFFAHSTDLLARIAAILGQNEDATRYRALHGDIVAAFQREFLTPAGRLASSTQTAHILTLHFNLAQPEHRPRLVRDLLQLLVKTKGHLETGFLGTPYFCQTLSDNGCLDQAYDLLLKQDYPSWLYSVTRGATTIWEHWDGLKPDGSMWSADMNSFNHYAYGSIGDWLIGTVAGLNSDPEQPGYKRIVFRPMPGGGLSRAEASHLSPYGKTAIRWQIEHDIITIQIEVPANTTASLTLPRADRERFVGHPSLDEADRDAVTLNLGSGRWSFQYAWPGEQEDFHA